MDLRLEISNLYKNYNGKPVLADCSYSFDKPGIYVLMGANGSGKSTLFKICALIEQPDKGNVNYFSGTELLDRNIELMRRITLVFPKSAMFNASVYKNTVYGLNIRKIDKKKINQKVDEVLNFVGLAHKKNQNALTLSSGETQRLGIARALAIEPEIIFLDEPTASVDEENTAIIENIILKLKENHTKMLLTTHDKSQAERLADHLLILEKGNIKNLAL